MVEEMLVALKNSQVKSGTPIEDIKLTTSEDPFQWPRFDTYDFRHIEMHECGNWIILLTQLQEGANYWVNMTDYLVKMTKDKKTADELKSLKPIWEAYRTHYRDLAKAMSRLLTQKVEEAKLFGIEARVT